MGEEGIKGMVIRMMKTGDLEGAGVMIENRGKCELLRTMSECMNISGRGVV
jgi:hypothetical protein